MPEINKEKQDILKINGNTLASANPGAGKTLLLAFKYLELLKNGAKPEEILCLTFTRKAKDEMRERIAKYATKAGLRVDTDKLNIHTFHSYALEQLEARELVSATYMRYMILQYLNEKKSFNYRKNYLAGTIVPGIENHIKYLKSFGFLPDAIDLKAVQDSLEASDKHSLAELQKYAEIFVNAWHEYEKRKDTIGIDYPDMLIQYDRMERKPKFKFVLVDELQDVNRLEAKMALEAGETFFAVGDKKQAIFAFQGGSLANFDLFENGEKRTLSENFRSSNEILNYAREYYSRQTQDNSQIKELESLHNNIIEGDFDIPKIYALKRDEIIPTAVALVKKIADSKEEDEKIAVITRTNGQIEKVSSRLKNLGIEHSATFEGSSETVKSGIIEFLRGFFTHDPDMVVNSFFTPFSPISLEKASAISEKKLETIEEVFAEAPEIEKLYTSVKNVEDINRIFNDIIIPICVAYGEEYVATALAMHSAFAEALQSIKLKTYPKIMDYLFSATIEDTDKSRDAEILVTTIHKAKGKEFDYVIYLQSKTKEKETLQNIVFRKIKQYLKINDEIESEEEDLRLDFVAITRAKQELHVLTKNAIELYVEGSSELVAKADMLSAKALLDENSKRAYNLFINEQYDDAKLVLLNKKQWLKKFIARHFENLSHLSYSAIKGNATEYLKDRIFVIRHISAALSLGSEVHNVIEKRLKREEADYQPEAKPYIKNADKVIAEIRKKYPEFHQAELKIKATLRDIFDIDSDIEYTGFIDAIFCNEDRYLLVDWKTGKKTDDYGKHWTQLETYRIAFAKIMDLPIENISTAAAYIGIRPGVNTGEIKYELKTGGVTQTTFNNFKAKVRQIADWKANPELFCSSFLSDNNEDDYLWRAVAEQLNKEGL